MNGDGISMWDADSVPWTTVVISWSVSVHCSGSNTDSVDTEGICSYSEAETFDAEDSGTQTFHRQSPHFETFTQDNDSWAVVRMLKSPELLAGSSDSWPSVYSHIVQSGVGSPPLFAGFWKVGLGAALPVDLEHTVTFAQVGPSPEGGSCRVPDDIPANISETIPAMIGGGGVSITQDVAGSAANHFNIEGGAGSSLGSILAAVGRNTGTGGTPVQDSSVTTPVTFTVHDLKVDGAVDFGSSASGHFENPDTDFWDTWDVSWTFSFACS